LFKAFLIGEAVAMIEVFTLFVVGLVVGGIASFLMPGPGRMAAGATAAIGIIGAFLGGWIGQALGFYKLGAPAGWIGGVVGALLTLFLYQVIARRPRTRP
jgi:uncharacterized membrane protein YeaQ/YmgE (transglycosylase-associated protein family)